MTGHFSDWNRFSDLHLDRSRLDRGTCSVDEFRRLIDEVLAPWSSFESMLPTWAEDLSDRVDSRPQLTNEELLPTEVDFDPTARDPDARWAWVNLGGLTIEQAARKLQERSDIFPEAFMCMSGKAFVYYFPAIESHLHTVPADDEEGDDYGAWMLASAVQNQFQNDIDRHVLHLAPKVIALSQYVQSNINRFGYDDDRSRILDAWVELENHINHDHVRRYDA